MQTQPTVVKDTIVLHSGHLKIASSTGSTPRSYESFLSSYLSDDGRKNLLEAWYPAKLAAPTKRKQ